MKTYFSIAAHNSNERGHQAEVGRPRAKELRQKCRMEIGGGPVGHGGSLLRSHPRGLPSLPHSGGHPTSGLEIGVLSGHLGKELGRQRKGLRARRQAGRHAHVVLPL